MGPNCAARRKIEAGLLLINVFAIFTGDEIAIFPCYELCSS